MSSRRTRGLLGVVVALTFLAPAGVDPEVASARTATAKNGLITFAVRLDQPVPPQPVVSRVLDDYDLFTIKPDGTALQAIRQGPQGDFDPVWSPDGGRIAFASAPRFTLAVDIYIMNADGSGLVNLTNSPERDDHQPAWSPDGRQIVFASALAPVPEINNGDIDLYVVSAEGGTSQPILQRPGDEIHPAWSRDGRWIAFVQDLASLCFVTPQGEGRYCLPSSSPNVLRPEWSPDGRWIAFGGGTSSVTAGSGPDGLAGFDVFVVRRNGNDLTNLTASQQANDLMGAWSPDGKKIAFLSERAGPMQLYVMNRDGSQVQRLVDLDLTGSRTDWAPRP